MGECDEIPSENQRNEAPLFSFLGVERPNRTLLKALEGPMVQMTVLKPIQTPDFGESFEWKTKELSTF